MRRIVLRVVWAGVALAPALPAWATPVGTAFTYQGQLKQDGAPYAGLADVQFSLWNAAAAGGQVGSTLTRTNVDVINGLFQVDLDFAASPFAGEARFLQIAVRIPAGTGSYVTLTPRQALNPVPYALRAADAPSGNSLDAADGSPVDAVFVDNSGNVGVGTTTPDNKLHVHKGSAGTVTADGNSVLVVENSTNAYASILTPDANERGILFGEPSNNVAGGIIYNSAATPDGLQFRTNGNNVRMVVDSQGEVGIGTTAPAAPLDIALGARNFQIRNDGNLVPAINLTGTSGNLGILRVRNKIETWPNDAGTTAASIDVRNTSGAPTVSFDGATGNINANGAVRVDGADTNAGTTANGVLRFGSGNSGEVIASKRTATGNQYGLDFYTGFNARLSITNGGNVGIGTTAPVALLDVNGRTRTGSLEIVGGADLAEPFEVRDTGTIEPGMVVVIDPDRPGKLAISTEAYDPKVAGIVSGANGLSPGMVMKASGEPLADGEHPVALSGRVWCKCDASTSAIRPGDLLTTSAVPGHAMKVGDDRTAPRGAIIGKAMTTLPTGQGLVLVLVNLQ